MLGLLEAHDRLPRRGLLALRLRALAALRAREALLLRLRPDCGAAAASAAGRLGRCRCGGRLARRAPPRRALGSGLGGHRLGGLGSAAGSSARIGRSSATGSAPQPRRRLRPPARSGAGSSARSLGGHGLGLRLAAGSSAAAPPRPRRSLGAAGSARLRLLGRLVGAASARRRRPPRRPPARRRSSAASAASSTAASAGSSAVLGLGRRRSASSAGASGSASVCSFRSSRLSHLSALSRLASRSWRTVRMRAISRFACLRRAGFSSAPVADWKRRLKSSCRRSDELPVQLVVGQVPQLSSSQRDQPPASRPSSSPTASGRRGAGPPWRAARGRRRART